MGNRKGNKKENKKGKKRPRELSPPTPPPTPPPPPTPTPPLSLGETAPAPALDFKAAHSGCPAELKMNFRLTLGGLLRKGIITDRNDRLKKTEESVKQSWDIGQNHTISFINRENEEVKRYLNSAAKNNYFDVPDPKERPESRGFYVIYPEGQDQKDPIFERKPNFIKFVPLISKLGMAAVECHKFMTGSDLKFSKVKKANLFCHPRFQVYFITLEATDKLSGKEVTYQSRVVYNVEYNEMWRSELEVDLLPVRGTYVESFHRVED